MAQGKSKRIRDIQHQDVSVQMQNNEDEIYKCFQNCNPPPPPGGDELWDLQFCRWWGWNWVRKRQLENENKQVPKKTFKGFCNCLPFQKGGAKAYPLQNLYNTPSNSVVVRETHTTEVAKKKDSMQMLEIERNISQENKTKIAENTKQSKSWSKAQEGFTSSDECYCCMTERSDTEDSIEYIKIKCCQCSHHVEKPPLEKCDCETQTSKQATNMNVTQTSHSKVCTCKNERKNKSKKRRICVICCHCCKCKNQNVSCNKKINVNEDHIRNNTSNKFTTFMKPTKTEGTLNEENPKYMPYHPEISKYQLEKLLYCNNFPKFPMSQQNYIKRYNTKSDVTKKLQKLTIKDKFSSPISGEIYHLSPIKVDGFSQIPTVLPDPIDITEDLEHLRKIKNEFQTDQETRIMLDALCDAILANNSCYAPSSTILNEVTYSLKDPNLYLNDTFNIDDKLDLPKHTPIFNEANYCTKLNSSKLNYSDSPGLNYFLNNENQNKKNTTNVDDIINSLMLNYNTTQKNYFGNQLSEYQWVNNSLPNISTSELDQPKAKFMKEYFPVLPDIRMKEQLRETKNHGGCNTNNINDIFTRIEEIILKSKVNDTEIQNMLNVIPNKTPHFISSEEIICENNPDDIGNKESVRNNSSLTKTLSDKCSQQLISSNCKAEEICKPRKILLTEMLEDQDDENKMSLTKKRKKNVKSLMPLAKRSDKFKSCKRK